MKAKQSNSHFTPSTFERAQSSQCNTLMIQGTTSDAGKTTLVAGLCRVFADLDINVAPFKPQNMALNSAVTPCGGEIGRAQALQAKAARLSLDVDFNPILLKPNSDTGAQVIVHGKALIHKASSNMEASEYQDYKKVAMQAVLSSHQRLTQQYDLIVVEGAGSPAEINLREGDIANMGFAEAVDCPVLIIADIDKGGVFAQLVGTLMLLSQSEQDRVVGFVINRFRGDIKLLESGLTWLEQKTNKPVLGVLPYLHGAKHLRYRGKVIGICGGYQMLGELITDPEGVEGQPGVSTGLSYFAMKTVLKSEKTLINVSGVLQLTQQNAEIKGYEIHAGQSTFIENDTGTKPSHLLTIEGEEQGLLSDDGQIAGCYLHGLFDQPEALQLFMSWLGYDVCKAPSIEVLEEQAIERVSKACQAHLDMVKIKQIVTKWYE